MVEELSTYTPQDLADLDALMQELSASSFCDKELLEAALGDTNVHVFVIREEGHIVATGTLCVKHTLEFTIADVESVVVSSSFRGRGYGKELISAMIDYARRESGNVDLHLTSRPERVVANELYKSLGFMKRETNAYVMRIKEGK